MPFPNSDFDGNFCDYLFGKCFGSSRIDKILLEIATFIMRKKYLIFFICETSNIFRMVKYIYEAHICMRSLVQTSSLESTSLCLNNRLSVNKKFRNSNNFY